MHLKRFASLDFFIFGHPTCCKILNCVNVLDFWLSYSKMPKSFSFCRAMDLYDLNDRLYLMGGLHFHKETYGLPYF